MNYDAYSFVIDFAFMSLLLVIAQFLRSKIKFGSVMGIDALSVVHIKQCPTLTLSEEAKADLA